MKRGDELMRDVVGDGDFNQPFEGDVSREVRREDRFSI